MAHPTQSRQRLLSAQHEHERLPVRAGTGGQIVTSGQERKNCGMSPNTDMIEYMH
jgi:hypothetical protein